MGSAPCSTVWSGALHWNLTHLTKTSKGRRFILECRYIKSFFELTILTIPGPSPSPSPSPNQIQKRDKELALGLSLKSYGLKWVCGIETSPVGNSESYPLQNSKSEFWAWACPCQHRTSSFVCFHVLPPTDRLSSDSVLLRKTQMCRGFVLNQISCLC